MNFSNILYLCYSHKPSFYQFKPHPLKNIQLGSNLDSKGLNCVKANFEDQIEIFQKFHY
jgi:hypothetical protein